MAFNNKATLIGNMGAEARIIDTGQHRFAAISLATTDSYKDANDQWQQKESIWHQVIAFSPSVIQVLKSLKKGTRVTIEGTLSYRDFPAFDKDGKILTTKEGKPVTWKEASIIAHKVTSAPLPRKR